MPAVVRRATSWLATLDCDCEQCSRVALIRLLPERTRDSDGSGQMRIHHKKNRVRRIKRQENKSIAYEASVLDSLPGKNRCHSRPIVGSSWLLQVKWQSWQ